MLKFISKFFDVSHNSTFLIKKKNQRIKIIYQTCNLSIHFNLRARHFHFFSKLKPIAITFTSHFPALFARFAKF